MWLIGWMVFILHTVSIQLISLASRDIKRDGVQVPHKTVSIQLISLASRDFQQSKFLNQNYASFHSINIPSE